MPNQASEASSSDPSPLYTVPPGHLLLHLSSGETAAFQLPKHPAASFYLYIPSSHPVSRRKRGEQVSDSNGESSQHNTQSFPLVVCVHGSARDAQGVRDRWAALAEKEGFVVLCPLFPVDMQTVDGMHNYKLIRYPLNSASSTTDLDPKATRFDLLLLEMVDLIRDRWGYVHTERFALTGFSGGAQFAHRFFYLHPHRIHALSVGAPGAATQISSSLPWPKGISDTQRYFDTKVDISCLRRTPTHLVVGLEDKWKPVANDGSVPKINRIETMRMLRDDWRGNGLKVEYDEIEGVAHAETGVMDVIQGFILRHLRDHHSG